MAKTGLSQALPYKFRSTGANPTSIANILQAPSLKIVNFWFPPEMAITAVLADPEGEPRVINTDTKGYHKHDEIMKLLLNLQPNISLWEVGIWTTRLELNFRDLTTRQLKPDLKAISSKISCVAAPGLKLVLTAQPYNNEPERHLVCRYDENAVLGRFVRIGEYDQKTGMRSAEFYPSAKLKPSDLVAMV